MKHSKSKRLSDRDVTVGAKVGTYVILDGRQVGECLLPCDDWDDADFRWPNPIPEWRTSRAIACNVHVTGRTVQYRMGSFWVRCTVEWVGDGEPNTSCKGWIFFDNRAALEYHDYEVLA